MTNYEIQIMETKEIVFLNDVRFNLDFIGNIEGETENFVSIMTQDNYDWWVDYINRFNAAEDAIIENIEGGTFNEDYHNFINGVEFNELPEAMEKYLCKFKNKKMKNEIEQEHNVYVDDDCKHYNHTSHDSETGWLPIPEEWLE